MEFGIGLMGYPGCWEDAAFAEEHGFGLAGFVDSPVLSGDPFVWTALAGHATSKMKVGAFVAIPGIRTATATAAALAAAETVAPGRVFYGTGTGYTGRLTVGFKGPVAASKLCENAARVRALLAGEEIIEEVSGAPKRILTKYPRDLQVDPDHPLPIYVAADGPKALQAAGEVGDGLITTLQFSGGVENRPATFENGLAAVRSAARDVDRDLEGAYSIFHAAICILEPGESLLSPRALAHIGPITMTLFHSYACDPRVADHFPQAVRERLEIYETEVLARLDCPRELLYQQVHAGHLTELLDGEAGVLTEEILRMIAVVGTAEEIVDQLRALQDKGLKNVTFTIPRSCVRETVLAIEQQIMPHLVPTTA